MWLGGHKKQHNTIFLRPRSRSFFLGDIFNQLHKFSSLKKFHFILVFFIPSLSFRVSAFKAKNQKINRNNLSSRQRLNQEARNSSGLIISLHYYLKALHLPPFFFLASKLLTMWSTYILSLLWSIIYIAMKIFYFLTNDKKKKILSIV